MKKMKFYKLKEITSKIGSGATPRGGQESYKKKGISFIRSQNVIDFQFSPNGLAFIDQNQARALDNVSVCENDILLNITGDSVARVCMVPKGILPARVNQHVSIIRVIGDKVDAKYLMYYLLNPYFKKIILKIASDGGTRKALTKSDIENFEVRLPFIDEQKAISLILSQIDNKIDLLRRQNETLENIAQALFRRWFVDFEFPDKNGKPYKSSGGKMIPSELGDIPEGWRAGRIGDKCFILSDTVAPYRNSAKSFFHYSIPAYDEGMSPKSEFGNQILSNKFTIRPYTILVSKLNPRTSRIWPIFEIDETCSICSTEFQIIKPENNDYYSYIYCLFKSKYVRKEMAQRATGTSGSHQRIRPDDILDIEVPIPKNHIMSEFNSIIYNVIYKVHQNILLSFSLSQVRDLLLPKLMSGQIRVQ